MSAFRGAERGGRRAKIMGADEGQPRTAEDLGDAEYAWDVLSRSNGPITRSQRLKITRRE